MELEDRIEKQRQSADFWADFFTGLNWLVVIMLAALGVLVAASTDSSDDHWWADDGATLIWGMLTAMLGAVGKSMEPSLKAEKQRTRKRAIELIAIEVRNGMKEEVADYLLVQAKIDPIRIVESLIEKKTNRENQRGDQDSFDGEISPT